MSAVGMGYGSAIIVKSLKSFTVDNRRPHGATWFFMSTVIPSSTGASTGELPSAPRGWVLGALMCTMMLAAMDTTSVSTAIPQIVGDLGGLRLFTWVFSIYLLAQTVTIPVYGKLSDLFGRKPVLITGTLVFLAGSVASSVSWNMVSLIVFRGLQGLGAGSIMATVITLAGDLYPVEKQGRVQGWLSSVWGVAAIVGPLMGGAFAQYATWRWIFLINLPVGAVALGLLGLFLHEHFERRTPSIDYAGAALVLASVGLLIFGVLQGGNAWPWLSPQSLGVFAASAVLIGATVAVERRAVEPIIPGWLWRHRALAGSNLAMMGMGVGMMAPYTYLPTFLQSVHHLNAIEAGLIRASMSIGWPAGSAISARFYTRLGYRDAALLGAVLAVASPVLFITLANPQPVWLLLFEQVLLGLGLGLLTTPLIVGVQASVGWSDRGVATGANMFARYLGQSLGAALFGAIFNGVVFHRLEYAPASLRGQLPTGVDGVITATNEGHAVGAVSAFLREIVAAATWQIYAAMAAIALVTLLAIMIAPRHFPQVSSRKA